MEALTLLDLALGATLLVALVAVVVNMVYIIKVVKNGKSR